MRQKTGPMRLALAVLMTLGSSRVALGQCPGRPVLDAYDRATYAAALAESSREVAVMLLSAPGCEAAMLEGLDRFGATVLYRDAKVGVALALVPPARSAALLDLPGLYRAQWRKIYPDPSPIPAEGLARIDRLTTAPFTISVPRLDTVLPPGGPFFPAADAGLLELWKIAPTADGRGIRVGVADDGFDLLHPSMQKARDANGTLVPKIADIDLVGFDDSWIRLGPPLTAKDGVIHVRDREWRVPPGGPYRFGAFGKQQLLTGEHQLTVDLLAAVLWDEATNRVWVDSDGDGDFTNGPPLRDYSVAQEYGWFGSRDEREDHRIPFAVKIDPARRAVAVTIGGLHGASIVGTLAANRLTGGLYDGAAPSVQVVDVRWGLGGVQSQVNVLRAIARPDIDVVHISGGIGGTDFDREVFTRALAVHRKPFASLNTLPNALRVEEYQSAEILRRNVQVPPPHGETIGLTNRMFEPDGVFNGVLVPSSTLSIQSRYQPHTTLWSDGKLHFMAGKAGRLSPAPEGYAVDGSLSGTIPFATGIVADLLGEARRQGVPHDHLRLINAIQISARLIPGYPTSEQKHGVIDAAAAWRQLVAMARADGPPGGELTRFAVATTLGKSRRLCYGFNRDWSTPGTTIDGELWITRTGGPADPRAYRFSLRGDDGTYRLVDQRAVMVRDSAVRVRFKARVTPGRHVAFLRLLDVNSAVVMAEIPLHVSAPEPPAPIAPGVDRYRTTLAPLSRAYRYLRIEPEVQAVRYEVKIPYSGNARVSPVWMPGFRNSAMEPPSGAPVDAAHHVGPMQKFESLVENDEGIGEILLTNHALPQYGTIYDEPGPTAPIAATLTVSKFQLSLAPRAGTITATNRRAPVRGRIEVYDAVVSDTTVGGAGTRGLASIKRVLPTGLSEWRVVVSTSEKNAGPIDAFLVSCSPGGGCSTATQREVGPRGATLEFPNPAAGEWLVIIQARDSVSTPMSYRVVEASLSRSPLQPESADSERRSGARWTVRLPKGSRPRYAAFVMFGNGKDGTGPRVAVTPLDSAAP